MVINGIGVPDPPEIPKLPEIEGWFNFQPFYEKIAQEAPRGATWVEVGVYQGKSLIWLAEHRPDLDLIGVDWGRGTPYINRESKTANALLRNLEDHNLVERIPILLWDSSKASRFFADESIWGVYIDGDHMKEGVRKDILAWAPKVVPGGYVSGDDYVENVPWIEVVPVVDEIYPERQIWDGPKPTNWTWWVRK